MAGATQLEEFREIFRASPVKRAKLSGLRRNLTIAMANSGDERFLPTLQLLSRDEDSLVAEHARWAINHLNSVAISRQNFEGVVVTSILLVQSFPDTGRNYICIAEAECRNPRQLTISKLARLLHYTETRSEAKQIEVVQSSAQSEARKLTMVQGRRAAEDR